MIIGLSSLFFFKVSSFFSSLEQCLITFFSKSLMRSIFYLFAFLFDIFREMYFLLNNILHSWVLVDGLQCSPGEFLNAAGYS